MPYETIVWTGLGHRLRRLCSVPWEILYTNSLLASFKREPVYRFFSYIRRTHITVMRRWHSYSSLIPHRHSRTHSQRRCLGHTSFFMHGDRCVHRVPCFQPGIDPFIGHPSRNGNMPVSRASCICSPIHRATTTSMLKLYIVDVKFIQFWPQIIFQHSTIALSIDGNMTVVFIHEKIRSNHTSGMKTAPTVTFCGCNGVSKSTVGFVADQ